MGEELVSPSPKPQKTIKETFEEALPYFMAIGMSYDEFWNKDPHLAQIFLQRDKIIRKRANEQMWLQGAYIYKALLSVAPLFQPFSKKPKAEKYLSKPFEITQEEQEASRLARQEVFRQTIISKCTNKKGE